LTEIYITSKEWVIFNPIKGVTICSLTGVHKQSVQVSYNYTGCIVRVGGLVTQAVVDGRVQGPFVLEYDNDLFYTIRLPNRPIEQYNTVRDIVADITAGLDEDSLRLFKTDSRKAIAGYGRYVRNAYGLWDMSPELRWDVKRVFGLKDPLHPDDVSRCILKLVVSKVHNLDMVKFILRRNDL